MKIRLILLLLFVTTATIAQRGSSCPEDLIPKYDKEKRLWGYADLFGQWVLEPTYTKVSPYIESKAVVQRGLQYGVLDCEGRVLIPAQFEMMTSFKYGKIWAKQKGLWGLMDEKGHVLASFVYSEINPIAHTELSWLKKDGQWGLFNEQKGTFICKPQYPMATIMSPNATLVEVNGMYGVLNHVNCQYLIEPKITKVKKVAPHIIVFKQNGKWGLFNEYGKLRLNPEFDSLYIGFTDVLVGIKNGKKGLYDLVGKELLPAEYDGFGEFSEGCFPIKKDTNYGYATRFGKVFITPQYHVAMPFYKKKAVVKKNQLYGVIDITNKILLPINKHHIYQGREHGSFAIHEQNNYALYDANLKKLTESLYDSIMIHDSVVAIRAVSKGSIVYLNGQTGSAAINNTFEAGTNFSQGMAQVKQAGKWGLIDLGGKYIIANNFDTLQWSTWGNKSVMIVQQANKKGVYDKTGIELLPCLYDAIYYTGNGLLKIKKDGLWGMIKTNGTIVAPFIYTQMSNNLDDQQSPEFPARICNKDQWGLINDRGEVILACKYTSLSYLSDGIYIASKGKTKQLINTQGLLIGKPVDEVGAFSEGCITIKKGKKVGLIDKAGVELIPVSYEELGSLTNNMIFAKKSNKWGVLHKSGKVLVPFEYEGVVHEGRERYLIKSGIHYALLSGGKLKEIK